jgi:NADP-dependent 3-hydroxy acid dehydrogenase YdfG
VDVRNSSELEAAIADFCLQSSGRLDIMFNNAGIAIGGYFEDLPLQKTRDMVDINLMGVLNGFHASIPFLKTLTALSASARRRRPRSMARQEWLLTQRPSTP